MRRLLSMTRVGILSISLLLIPSITSAQVGTPLSKVVFDQIAPDVKTASSYVYRIYSDGSVTGNTITVACTGSASPFICTFALPAFTPGSHSIQITASNAAGESQKSEAINFTFVVIPSAPTNLRIQ